MSEFSSVPLLLLGTVVLFFVLKLSWRASSSLTQISKEVRDELRAGREESRGAAKELRQEVAATAKSNHDTLVINFDQISSTIRAQLETMTKQLKDHSDSNQLALDRIRNTFDLRIKELQEGNEKRLNEMRQTVDEKLHDTLEKRLGESFKLVSDRLEAVHKGLGEMQNLASGVGDLKRVLTNVKARGTWAEVQLGGILEQILIPEQFEKNVQIKTNSLERVEYAIKLPGPQNDVNESIWLPIDSKFPQEDYLRLQQAAEKADPEAVQTATDGLVRAVRSAAKDIYEKYVDPPATTDFAIMFLATEGLYAEILKQTSFVEELQQRYRVVLAGPTTLAAILSSLRMGFQTLAIEQRSAEVWRILGAVKTEFGRFGEVLDKVNRQLETASETIKKTGVRRRAMERTLRSVEQLSQIESAKIFSLSELESGEDNESELEKDG